jgi:hypothetical protein
MVQVYPPDWQRTNSESADDAASAEVRTTRTPVRTALSNFS